MANNMNSGGSSGSNGATARMLGLDPDDHLETRNNVAEGMNRRSGDAIYNSTRPTEDMLSRKDDGRFSE